MRYVPNLILKEHRVLEEYFKGSPYTQSNSFGLLFLANWIIGIVFIAQVIAHANHLILILVFGLLGIMFIPHTQEWLQNKLRFRLTNKIKGIVSSVLFITAIPLTSYYADQDKIEEAQQKIIDEKNRITEQLEKRNDSLRIDSLNYFIGQAELLGEKYKIDEAKKQLELAKKYAKPEVDNGILQSAENNILAASAFSLVKKGKYSDALPQIENFLSADPQNTKLLYNRALCYSKTGKTEKAISDLKQLMSYGNTDAEKLYNKINPIRRTITGYCRKCCDGSTSYAMGRGACSHHGGVCEDNCPIYQESRKYE